MTNLSECVNIALKGTLNLPITALVKSTYFLHYLSRKGGRLKPNLRVDKCFHKPCYKQSMLIGNK